MTGIFVFVCETLPTILLGCFFICLCVVVPFSLPEFVCTSFIHVCMVCFPDDLSLCHRFFPGWLIIMQSVSEAERSQAGVRQSSSHGTLGFRKLVYRRVQHFRVYIRHILCSLLFFNLCSNCISQLSQSCPLFQRDRTCTYIVFQSTNIAYLVFFPCMCVQPDQNSGDPGRGQSPGNPCGPLLLFAQWTVSCVHTDKKTWTQKQQIPICVSPYSVL